MTELQSSFSKLGGVPQKHVTGVARKGIGVTLRKARSNAPVDTGALSRGMKLRGERSRLKGKKVHQIIFNPALNDIFQTRNASGNIVGYYPISMEYGFFTVDGRYIPGYAFVRKALEGTSSQLENIIISEMKKRIDKEISIKGLG